MKLVSLLGRARPMTISGVVQPPWTQSSTAFSRSFWPEAEWLAKSSCVGEEIAVN